MPGDWGRPASNASRGSRTKTGTYRKIADTSYVDETLFGSTKPGARSAGGKPQVETIDRASMNKARSLAGKAPKEDVSDYVMLGTNDLARMKKPCSVLTPDEVRAIKKEMQEQKDKERAVANQRKKMMVELEEERKKNMPRTETEQIKAEEYNNTTQNATMLLEEELDDVKDMNRMMLYAKCVTIRDAQIEERRHIIKENEEEDQRLDLMMEVERIKALELYEMRERKRAEDRKAGAAVLQKQIEERAAERERLKEIQEQEARAMLREIERLKEDEAVQVQRKKDAGRRLLAEVARANRDQIEQKKRIEEAEKEEDQRIAAYLRKKELKEAADAEMQALIAKQKEEEVARLRAQQERANDKQAELDEIRAMRAQEEYEREWRERERAEAERVAAINAELASARNQQKMVKQKQLADIARQEKQEFQRIIDGQRQKEMEDLQIAKGQQAIRDHHKMELQSQIQLNEEERMAMRKAYLEEGRLQREKLEAERLRLESVKSRKLNELDTVGVPSKYQAELSRKKIML
mmetsp:Transcript_48018/g.153922  ORF Transcript_48018/g.153922 Transcript_48018/m.153922 type:complete len:524 (+) Transcript_48018:49-1620(+)